MKRLNCVESDTYAVFPFYAFFYTYHCVNSDWIDFKCATMVDCRKLQHGLA